MTATIWTFFTLGDSFEMVTVNAPYSFVKAFSTSVNENLASANPGLIIHIIRVSLLKTYYKELTVTIANRI